MSMFGPEFEQIWPKAGQALKLTEFGKKLLKQCENIEKPDGNKISIQEFILKSSNFPIEFGTNTCRVISQPKERYPQIQQQIASAYPVIHERVLGLYLAFLEHKCQYGNEHELEIFPKLSLTGLVQRLLRHRCASFLDAADLYILLSGHSGFGGFEKVGTCNEKPPLTLANVLSYDEIKLSAFLSVSSHSEFLNDGNRYNAGSIEPNKDKIEREGVVVGIIGGRFERPGVMEWQDVVISKSQNTREHGYGAPSEEDEGAVGRAVAYRRIWRQFYEEADFRYDQIPEIHAQRSRRFHSFGPHYFDNLLMRKRYAISFDTLLLESEARAASAGRQAYVHVVGIGLGVWKAVGHQTSIFLETFEQRLVALLPQLAHVGCVHFSWFHVNSCGKLRDGGFLECPQHPNGGIRTLLRDRNPADKLPPEMENMLVVVSYAWDANALPGNEFWKKMLTATGDTSTACSTLIAELHNPHINDFMVNGDNLHVATLQHGVMHIADYSKHVMANIVDNDKK